MFKFALRSILFAACLAGTACTDEQASAPETASGDAASAASTPASPSAPTAAESAPSPTFAPRTSPIDGLSMSPLCALDSVNGAHASNKRFDVAATQAVTFEGWVATTNLQNPGTISIILDGQSDFEIGHVTGVARKDVADAYGSAALEPSGFKTALASLDVPADEYSVLLSHDEAGAPIICKTDLIVAVSR